MPNKVRASGADNNKVQGSVDSNAASADNSRALEAWDAALVADDHRIR